MDGETIFWVLVGSEARQFSCNPGRSNISDMAFSLICIPRTYVRTQPMSGIALAYFA